MPKKRYLLLAGALAVLLSLPAAAAYDDSIRGVVGIDLGDFEIVLSDSGDRFYDWDERPTRVYAEVRDGPDTRRHYFDNLPATIFVLRELYVEPQVVLLKVPVYTRTRYVTYYDPYDVSHELYDGRRLYYVWYDDYYGRGGVPLILPYRTYDDARVTLQYRDGEIMVYADLLARLFDWADRDRDRIYWRGWDDDRWDTVRWTNAWNDRWDGWNWDDESGWVRLTSSLDGDAYGDDPDRNWRDPEHWDRGRALGRDKDSFDDGKQGAGAPQYQGDKRGGDKDKSGAAPKDKRSKGDGGKDSSRSAPKYKRGNSGGGKNSDGDTPKYKRSKGGGGKDIPKGGGKGGGNNGGKGGGGKGGKGRK